MDQPQTLCIQHITHLFPILNLTKQSLIGEYQSMHIIVSNFLFYF